MKGQFRFEIFNVFNTTNFVGVNASLSPRDVTFDTGDASTATMITGATQLRHVRTGHRHA